MLGIGGAVLVALTAGLLRTVLPDPVRVFLILGAVVLWLWAVAHLAAGRGHDPILGVIFGLLGVGVLFLLLFLPDKTKAPPKPVRKESDKTDVNRDELRDLGSEAKY
jgi:hypothetical protein